MVDRVRRLVSVGVGESRSPSEARRIQTINVIAYLVVFFSSLYVVVFAFTDLFGLWPVIASNAISIAVELLAVFANARGKTDLAMWLLITSALFNLVFVSLFLGLGTGIFLFLVLPPITVVMVTPPNDIRTQVVFVAASVIAFVGVVLADSSAPESIAGTTVETALLVTSIVGTVVFGAFVAVYFRRIADTAEAELLLANERSEGLLLNILPAPIAERLKDGEAVIADRVEGVTVLFADLVGSTPMSEQLTPTRMVELLNEIFTPFDDLADEMGLEKIKTIGDAYMVVGGLPPSRPDHIQAVADMALAMREEVGTHSLDPFGTLAMRYGIHTGPVVAGVIGKRKFSYDLWGDTVNTAARMESQGIAGEIQVTGPVFRILKDRFDFTARGQVDIKGKGVMSTYFLNRRVAR